MRAHTRTPSQRSSISYYLLANTHPNRHTHSDLCCCSYFVMPAYLNCATPHFLYFILTTWWLWNSVWEHSCERSISRTLCSVRSNAEKDIDKPIWRRTACSLLILEGRRWECDHVRPRMQAENGWGAELVNDLRHAWYLNVKGLKLTLSGRIPASAKWLLFRSFKTSPEWGEKKPSRLK